MGDPSLEEVVKAALENNLDIEAAVARLQAARAVARQAAAALFPTVSGGYQRSRAEQPGFFGSFTGTSYSRSLAASYELDLWRRISSSARAAGLEANASRFDLEALIMGISAQAGELYYLSRSLVRQEALARRLVQELEEETRVIQERYIFGLSSADLFLDARRRAEVARQTLISIKEQRAKVRDSLFLLTGGVLTDLPPPRPGDDASRPHVAPPVGLPSGLLQYRPDVKAAFLRVQSADSRVAAALAELFPSISISGNWGHSTSATSFGDITGGFWSVAFSTALTILDGGRRRARVEEMRSRTMLALAQYRQAVLAAFKDVEDAIHRLEAAQQQEESLAAEEAAMEQVASFLEDRYNSGLASYDEVLMAKSQLTTVELALAKAEYQVAVAVISLYRAVGGGWMERYLQRSRKAENEER